MSRTIVQIVKASELRAGDVIVWVHRGTRDTVTDVLRGADQRAYWSGDETIIPCAVSWCRKPVSVRNGGSGVPVCDGGHTTDVSALDFRDSVTVTLADRSADILGASEPVMIDQRPATIAIYRTRWVPTDDGSGGTTEPDYLNDTVEEVEEIGSGPDLIDDAILALQRLGLFGDSEHSDRYIDPDGSQIIDYATGEREIVSAVLRDFDDWDEDRIRAIVGDAY